MASIDKPIIDLIRWFLKLPYCFTIQSCYGHFVYKGQKNPYNIKPLPKSNNVKIVEYRIAYLALCLQNSVAGRKLFEELSMVPQIEKATCQEANSPGMWTLT